MDFFILGLAVVGIAFFLPIFLLFRTHKMKEQIVTLERLVEGLLGGSVTPDAPTEEVAPQAELQEQHKPWKPPESRKEAQTTAVIEQVKKSATPPKAFVFKPEFRENLSAWLQKNWFFAIAAVSLALAGVFLVQYGVENGLLSPALRVISAIVLGAVLIGVGEYVRRKLGGDEDGSFALLPSAFSGAGLVSIFAGVLSARMMYQLIGPEVAFIGLGLTGALAIVLGWFYGPLLAVIGVIGALAAPFLVGGDSDGSQFLQFYFAGIAAVALSIDTLKRWAWLSSLGLIAAYGASWLLYLANSNELYLIAFALIAMLIAATIPIRSLVPKHSGARVFTLDWRKKAKDQTHVRIHSEFPTRLAVGAFIVSSVFVGMAYVFDPSVFWLSLAGVVILVIAAIFWMEEAIALRDLAYFTAGIGLAIIGTEAGTYGVFHQAWLNDALRPVMDFASPVLAILLMGALCISLAFAWRSWQNRDLKLVDAGVAAVFAPGAAIIAELLWSPSHVLGSGNWALYLSAIAIAMTALAERFSRKDGEDRLRTAMFALSAISMLSFVLIVMLGSFALTLALAVMVATAAWMGAKFNLPLFDRYVQVGVVAVFWRLVVDPGAIWAFDAELWQIVLTYVGVIGLLIGAYLVKRKDVQPGVIVMLESAIWSLCGVFATVILARYFDYVGLRAGYIWISSYGLIWLISSANQLYRIRKGAELRRTRIVLASIYALLGGALTLASVIGFNPLNGIFESGDIAGPYVLDSIFVAYALPGLLLAFVAFKFTHLGRRLRKWIGGAGAVLVVFYVGMEIRRFWHGDSIDSYQTFDGELYSYTVAMLLAAIALLVMAFVRQSSLLRKFALVAVGLTVAKVFLIDMSGLDGLLRVVSFLVLGLVLAAMAWVNRILQKNEAR